MAPSKHLLTANKLKENHQNCLSEHFNDLRKQKHMVDVSITCHGTKFAAHKIILRAASSLFQSAIDNDQDEIEINNLQVETLEEVMTFMYTGRLATDVAQSDWSSFTQLLCASNALGVHDLFKYCCQAAREKMDVDRFFEFWDLSERLGDLSMLSIVFEFASNNLDGIKKLEKFHELECDRMQTLLSQTDREVLSEDQLLDALLTWMKHDMESRQESFDDLFSSMKSGNLSSKYLGSIVHDPLFKSSEHISGRLQLSLQDSLPSATGNIYNLPEMTPELETFLKSLCFHHYYVAENVAFWQVYRVRDGWKEPTELPFLLASSCSVVHLGGYVYFAGGLDDGMKPTGRVLRYNPLSQIADFVDPLIKAVWDAVVGMAWGKVYMVGGKFLQNGLVMITDFVQSYDPATCTWTEIHSWHVYRSLASAITVNGNFYITGGFEYVDGTPCQRIVQYVANSAQPTVITLPEPVGDIGTLTAVCVDKIYVVRNGAQKSFLVFDPATKGWCARNLPGGPEMVSKMWSLCSSKQLPYILVMGSEGDLWLLHPFSGQWVVLGTDCAFRHSGQSKMVFTSDFF